MSFANTIKLTGLTTREAIADSFYRLMSSFDENSPDLFNSSITTDIAFHINGADLKGIDAVREGSLNHVGPMDTTHFVTSIRIDVDGENATTATLTANTLAQHYPAGTGFSESQRRLLGGSKHWGVLSRDEKDALWKFEKWRMQTVWFEGDRTVMTEPLK